MLHNDCFILVPFLLPVPMPNLTHNNPTNNAESPPETTMTHHFPGRATMLSVEILEYIFFLAQPEPEDEPEAERFPFHRYAPINTSQVCTDWRRVTLGRNGLWTTFEVVTDSKSVGRLVKGVDMAKTFFSRSGSILPLNVSVLANLSSMEVEANSELVDTKDASSKLRLATNAMHQYMRLVTAVRHRLQHLCLNFLIDDSDALEAPLPGTWPWRLDNMPRLEFLSVVYPMIGDNSEAGTIDLSACSTRLVECHIFGCLKISIADNLVLSNLTTLQFGLFGSSDNTLIASWCDILQRMPRLKTMIVLITEGLDWDLRNYSEVYILLPMLEELRVSFPDVVEEQDPNSPYDFIDGLWCPKLKEFEIKCVYDEERKARMQFNVNHDHTAFYHFLKNHGRVLEQLTIGCDLEYEYELGSALVHCTNLQYLCFSGIRFAENSELLSVLHMDRLLGDSQMHGENVSGPYCPKLELLLVTHCFISPTIKAADVADMIVDRLGREIARLEYFELDGCDVLDGVNGDPRIQAILATR